MNRKYENLNNYIGLQRHIIIQEQNGKMNISRSSNGGFHLFLTNNTGFTYGFGLEALKQATTDFETLLNKDSEERKAFVIKVENLNLVKELSQLELN